MPQSRFKAHKTAPPLKNTGRSTWNPIEKGPEYTALAVLHPKISFVGQPWGRHLWRLWASFQKFLSYAPENGLPPPFPFISVFLYCIEHNTRQVISLGEEAFSKYDSTMFLKQLGSSNNRFVPEISVKVFFLAYWNNNSHIKIVN